MHAFIYFVKMQCEEFLGFRFDFFRSGPVNRSSMHHLHGWHCIELIPVRGLDQSDSIGSISPQAPTATLHHQVGQFVLQSEF
jgi:hypothetical protein